MKIDRHHLQADQAPMTLAHGVSALDLAAHVPAGVMATGANRLRHCPTAPRTAPVCTWQTTKAYPATKAITFGTRPPEDPIS